MKTVIQRKAVRRFAAIDAREPDLTYGVLARCRLGLRIDTHWFIQNRLSDKTVTADFVDAFCVKNARIARVARRQRCEPSRIAPPQ